MSLKQPKEVSASIRAFAKSNSDTDAYNLTAAYSDINEERDDVSTYTFSQAVPAGRRNSFGTLRTGGQWASETTLIRRQRGGGGARGGSGRNAGGVDVGGYTSGLSKGAIVGIVLGSMAAVAILCYMEVYLWRRWRSYNEHRYDADFDDEIPIKSTKRALYEPTNTREQFQPSANPQLPSSAHPKLQSSAYSQLHSSTYPIWPTTNPR